MNNELVRSLKGFPVHKSGTSHCVRVSPAGPRAPHLALPNRVLVGGLCITRTPARFALSCGSDFALRSESIGCSAHSLPAPSLRGPFHVDSQSHATRVYPSLIGTATRREKGAPPETQVRGETSARAANGFKAHREIALAGEPDGRSGSCYTHPDSEDAIYQSALELKGASGGHAHAVACPRHVYGEHPARGLKE